MCRTVSLPAEIDSHILTPCNGFSIYKLGYPKGIVTFPYRKVAGHYAYLDIR